MRSKERVLIDKIAAHQNKIIDNIPIFIDNLNCQINDMDYVFCLNKVIVDVKDTIFTNFWIHCNSFGNKIIAEYVSDVLRINLSGGD